VSGWITAAAGLVMAAFFAAQFFRAGDMAKIAKSQLAQAETRELEAKSARDLAQHEVTALQQQIAKVDDELKDVQQKLAAATVELSTAQRLATLLLNSDNTKLAWSPGNDANGAGLQGEVVWNTRLQEGFMRFKNLKANDPLIEQYQAWIFDGGRDMTYPVDAGVFDVAQASVFFDPQSGDFIVPISAKLKIVDPKVFAVTVERPGGVVVTKKERVVALAQPK
jgi:hypothetical protein